MSYLQAGCELTRWAGPLPKSWQDWPLKFAVNLRNDEPGADEDLIFVGLENIESATGRLIPSVEVEGVPAPPGGKRFRKGQVLFSKLRPYLAKSFVADNDGRCTGELLVFEPLLTDPRFLKYCLLSDGFINTVDASTYGAKMPRAEWGFIGRLRIPLPKMEIQRAVADYLDRETALIDELITEKERMLALLDEKRNALITRAVTIGLNPGAKMKESEIEWLAQIPKHWRTPQLKRTFSQVDYGISDDIRGPGSIKVLRMGNIQDGSVVLEGAGEIDDVDPALMLHKDDLLFNRTNSLDQIAKVGLIREEPEEPLTFASYLVRLRTNSLARPKFLNYLLNSKPFRGFARGQALPAIGQANLNPSRLGEIHVCLPHVDEQDDIVDYLDVSLANTRELVAKLSQSLVLLSERRTALITSAVTGKINVVGCIDDSA